jgi:hypothetical protein
MVVMPAVAHTKQQKCITSIFAPMPDKLVSDRMQLAAHSATEECRATQDVSRPEKTKVSVFGKTGAIGARGIVSTDTTGGDGFRATASVRPEVLQGWLVPHEGAWVRSTGQRHCEPHAPRESHCDRPTTVADGRSSSVAPVPPSKRALVCRAGISPPLVAFI